MIKVIDADMGGRRGLLLDHEHEGRDLDIEYAEKTLGYLHYLWGREVALRTRLNDEPRLLSFDSEGFQVSARTE